MMLEMVVVMSQFECFGDEDDGLAGHFQAAHFEGFEEAEFGGRGGSWWREW